MKPNAKSVTTALRKVSNERLVLHHSMIGLCALVVWLLWVVIASDASMG
jgi:hypothetical protein